MTAMVIELPVLEEKLLDLSSRGGLTAGGRGNREFGVRRWIVRELGG